MLLLKKRTWTCLMWLTVNTLFRCVISHINPHKQRLRIHVFRLFWPPFQGTFHLSFAVLLRYRSLIQYLALEEIYLPTSDCTIKQSYSEDRLATSTFLGINGTFTHYGHSTNPVFQRTVKPKNLPTNLLPNPTTQLPKGDRFRMGSSRFTRRYSENPF